MEHRTIAIRNMVCDRCVEVVRAELARLGLHPVRIVLGEAEFASPLSETELSALDAALRAHGFERIDDRRGRLVERVKTLLITLVHREEPLPVNLSAYLSEAVGLDYGYLSTLFSEATGVTVERYFIAQKIERVKELLTYDELTLSEIAFRLGYSSVSHLSAQFKKVTGVTPSSYKRSGAHGRCPLDKVGIS